MWMRDYEREVKRQLRDVYHFAPVAVDIDGEPIFSDDQIPNGVYPMTIADQMDRVRVEEGRIYCCNFVRAASS